MYLLRSLLAWCSRVLERMKAKKTTEEPAWLKEKPVEGPPSPDIRFYTETYKITSDDKKMLASLVQKPEFRVFEKYLDWRINASAHRMKALLLEEKGFLAASEAAAIESLVRVTQDMQNFWKEVISMDTEEGILIAESNEVKLRAFGADRFDLE